MDYSAFRSWPTVYKRLQRCSRPPHLLWTHTPIIVRFSTLNSSLKVASRSNPSGKTRSHPLLVKPSLPTSGRAPPSLLQAATHSTTTNAISTRRSRIPARARATIDIIFRVGYRHPIRWYDRRSTCHIWERFGLYGMVGCIHRWRLIREYRWPSSGRSISLCWIRRFRWIEGGGDGRSRGAGGLDRFKALDHRASFLSFTSWELPVLNDFFSEFFQQQRTLRA